MSPTHAAWCGIAAYVAAIDLWLLHNGHSSMSALARRNPCVTAVAAALLTTHLMRAWRYDPLYVLGSRLELRRALPGTMEP